MVPTRLFFTKGVGRHREKLQSFELALRRAGISHFNLVRVSSIFPPGCRIIPRSAGVGLLGSGEVVYCVMADTACDEAGRLVAVQNFLPREPPDFHDGSHLIS